MQTSTKLAQESGVWKVLPASSSQIRYGSVSWSFDTPHYAVKPPHYHGSLLRTSRPRRRYMLIWNAKPFGPSQHPTTLPHDPAQEWSHSDSLNHQFIAIKVAEDVLRSYEVDVGFARSTMSNITLDESCSGRVELSADVDEEQVQLGRSQWAVLARDLIGDIHLSRVMSTPDLDVYRPQSSLSSLEYDSEPSTDSDLPRTPTQRSTFSNVEVHQPSPVLDSRGLSPPRTLNKSARPFTPKSGPPSKSSRPLLSPSRSRPSPVSSPTPVNFAFPAINGNYQYLPQGLKKDDQGFYTSVTPPSSPLRVHPESRLSSTRLPHFLSDAQSSSRKASKTRVIVDRMKAIPVTGKKGRPRNHSQGESSASPSDAGDTKNSDLTKDQDTDAVPTFSPPTPIANIHVTAGDSEWKESPTQYVKASFPNSTIPTGCPSFSAPPAPDASFLVQPLVPSFYTISHAPVYPYSYVLGPVLPPLPTTTSWVPITPPAFSSGMYTGSVVAHATW